MSINYVEDNFNMGMFINLSCRLTWGGGGARLSTDLPPTGSLPDDL